MLVGWVVKKEVLMKNEQPRLDDAVQPVVEAKYNKLQAKGLCATRFEISMRDK